MKSVFDSAVRGELSARINSLSPQHTALWGKMNVYQMVRHCMLCDKMFFGELKIKRVWMGRLFGKMVLKKVLKDEKPFNKNAPTSPLLKTGPDGEDMDQLKNEWSASMDHFATYNNPGFVHPFFGPMTREQVGYLAYKHTDHHLRQFGA